MTGQKITIGKCVEIVLMYITLTAMQRFWLVSHISTASPHGIDTELASEDSHHLSFI